LYSLFVNSTPWCVSCDGGVSPQRSCTPSSRVLFARVLNSLFVKVTLRCVSRTVAGGDGVTLVLLVRQQHPLVCILRRWRFILGPLRSRFRLLVHRSRELHTLQYSELLRRRRGTCTRCASTGPHRTMWPTKLWLIRHHVADATLCCSRCPLVLLVVALEHYPLGCVSLC